LKEPTLRVSICCCSASKSTPAGSRKRLQVAKAVVDQARGVNPKLERMFDRLYRQKPVV
jgi:hypothetical protein